MVLFELVIAIVIAIGLLFIGGRINATSPYVKLFILRLPLDASIQAKLLVWFLPIPLAEHMAFSTSEIECYLRMFNRVEELPIIQRGMKTLGMQKMADYYATKNEIVKKASKFTHPMQRPYTFYPGITAQPWYDTSKFSWVPMLESKQQVIKEELMRLWEKKEGFQPYRVIENNKFIKKGGGIINPETEKQNLGWMMYYFFHHGKVNDNCSECPETAKALESIPRFRTTFACFSALNPGTGLGKHFGPSNGILRCHLAVHIPEPDKTTITVCDETRHWEEGKVMIFDDSFEHQVSHKGSKTRVVLFFDVYHPDWSDEELARIKEEEMKFRELFTEEDGSFINRMQKGLHEDRKLLQGYQWWSK